MAHIIIQLKDWLLVNQGTIERFPTGVGGTKQQFLEACCAIHKPVEKFNDGLGCALWKPGTHAAIRAIDRDQYHFCDTKEGQRALDWLLSTYPFDATVNRESALNRTNAYKRKFAAGSYAHTSVYGPGYCYIALFMGGIRNRIARILGPNPLAADVARYLIYAGELQPVRMKLRLIRPGYIHVSELKYVSGNDTVVSILECLIVLIQQDPLVKIGIDFGGFGPDVDGIIDRLVGDVGVSVSSELIVQAKREIAELMQRSDFTPRIVSDAGSLVYYGSIEAYADMIHNSFAVDGDHILLREFPDLFSTIFSRIVLFPLSIHAVAGAHIKEQIRVLAMIGDSVLRVKVCVRSLHIGAAPVDVQSRLIGLSNESLASAFISSGLKDISATHHNSSAKEKADSFEAMVGYAYYILSSDDIDKFLTLLGIIV